MLPTEGVPPLPSKVTMNSVGAGTSSSKIALTSTLALGMSELVVLDGHAAADDLPLLEVVALVGRCGQGDRRTGRSGGRSCGTSAVSVIADGNGVGGGGNNAVFPQRLDLGIPIHCVGISYLVLRAAYLPCLELLIGGSGEATGGQDVICPCLDGHGSHAAAAAVAVKGDNASPQAASPSPTVTSASELAKWL